jgi:hypothetical protein
MKRLIPSLIMLTSCGSAAALPPVTTTPETTTTVPPTTTSTTTTTTVALVTTTTITAPADSHCPHWYGIALDAGWPESEWARLDYVLWRESRCDAEVHNKLDPATGSYGGVQINGFWCRKTTSWLRTENVLDDCTDLFQPATAMRAALAIWHRSGWVAWGF